MASLKLKDEGDRKTFTTKAFSKVCRKLWRKLDLAAGSPTPPMRINSASALLEGELYLFGGLNAGPSKSMWVLNVRERRWRPIPAKKGIPPPPRQGHTMCWDGKTSLWVFGGQGADTTSADSSRTHQGVKIRTLAKRTCFNDFHEFDTTTLEWRDHVQAGVCPTSRRGHTATLVLGRRIVKPSTMATVSLQSLDGTKNGRPSDNSNITDAVHSGGETVSGESHIASSPQRARATGGGDRTTPGKRLEGRSSKRLGGQGDEGSYHGGGLARGRTSGGEAEGEAENIVSREMFVIGGAGTDPIRNMEVVHPQLWIFDFDLSSWSCVEPGKGGGKRGNASTNNGGGGGGGGGGACPGPPAVFDHTATLIGNDHILVVGGVKVGTTLNSEVFMLTLETLKWSKITPNALGFPAPAVHGHTAVEDPSLGGRVIVFGGRGGTHWNTEVLTFNFKESLWSVAVCDTIPALSPGAGSSTSTVASLRRRVAIKDQANGSKAEISPSAALATGSNESAKAAPAPIPHQRSGHTCFVWDPRDTTRTCSGEASRSGGPGGSSGSAANKRGASRSEESNQNKRGSVSERGKRSPKWSRGGGVGESEKSLGTRRAGRVSGKRGQPPDDPLSYPCIVTFGGSALRAGGGYAEAELHVLENPPSEAKGEDDDSDGEEEGGDGGGEGKASSVGVLATLESAASSRRKSFNKFQTCTQSIIFKVHSLRQLGRQCLEFGDTHNPHDLSYVESKVRSVILGEVTRSKDGSTAKTQHSSHRSSGAGKVSSHGQAKLGVFPTGYEQVKAFLADSRPVRPGKRPASAPADSGGGCGDDRIQGVSRGVGETKRPGTAGAALGGGGDQRSTLSPMRVRATSASSSMLARPSSKITVGGATASSSYFAGSTVAAGGSRDSVGSDALHGGAGVDADAIPKVGGSGGRNTAALIATRSASAGAMRARAGRHGRSPLLPKSTLAAHNGRMLMEYEWANAGFY